jgi:hypothetical protein
VPLVNNCVAPLQQQSRDAICYWVVCRFLCFIATFFFKICSGSDGYFARIAISRCFTSVRMRTGINIEEHSPDSPVLCSSCALLPQLLANRLILDFLFVNSWYSSQLLLLLQSAFFFFFYTWHIAFFNILLVSILVLVDSRLLVNGAFTSFIATVVFPS